MTGLADAAQVLDDLAAGKTPERARVVAGALALDTLTKTTRPSRDVLDAAAGLEIIAKGGTLDLDEKGRDRAATLAEAVRQLDQATPPARPSDGTKSKTTKKAPG